MKIGYLRPSVKNDNRYQQIGSLQAAGCDEIVEEEVSFAFKEHPELDALIEKLAEGDTLVVCGLECLGPTVSAINVIVAKLRAKRIVLHSLREKIDTSSRQGIKTVAAIAMLAKTERLIASEVSHYAAAARAAKKQAQGNPPPLRSKLSDRDVRLILALIDQGIPKVQIAKKFNVSPETLYKTLKNPRYMNEVVLRPRHGRTPRTPPETDSGEK